MDVSSPGAERELKRPQDFEWALEKIYSREVKPTDGRTKRN